MRASEFTKQELDEKINPQVVEPGFTAEKKLGNRYVMKAEARYTGEPGDDLRGLIIKVYDTKAKPTMLNWGIGMTRFVARQDPNTQDWYLVSSTTHVDDRYQRQGLASAMYNWARELGNDIEPSSNRTKMGKHFWEKGAGAGREFVDQPPEISAPPAIPTAAGPAKAQSLRDRLVKMFTEEPDLAERKQSPLEDFEGLQFRMVNDNGQLFVNALDSTWGNELGHVTFDIGDGKDLDPQDLFVKEKFQGQGIARIMYDFVKSKGYKIQRSWDQTDAGAGFWDKHRGEERVWEQGVAEGYKHDYLSQISKLIWKPVSRSIWNTIQDEGLDEEQDAPDHINWVMASLSIDPKDAQALQAFDNNAIEDFNRFDIHLKSRYPGLTDLIDYDRGTVTIVKPINTEGLAENFADGRNPQDKGDSQRHGIPKNATMAELEKASHAKGRKGQLARWQLNMRRGHKK